MSRTDKDKPLHARAVWWEPDHWGCQNMVPRSLFAREHRECDLPAGPDPSRYDRTARWGRRATWRCRWEPVPDPLRDRAYGTGSVPKWFIDHVWHNVNRTAERAHGRRAIAEYRATGDVDTVLPAEQHRHRAAWLFW